MRFLKKGIVLLLTVIMAASFTSCKDTTWVFKYGDETITSGVYLAYLLDSYSEVSSDTSLDSSQDVLSQTLSDGTSTVDEIIKKAEDYARRALFSMAELKNRGIELTDELFATADSNAQYTWAYYSSTYEENGTGQESFNKYYRYSYSSTILFEDIYGEGGEKEIPVEDLLKYYGENYYEIYSLSASLVDSEGTALEDSEKETIKSRLDGYVDMINEGSSFDTIKVLEDAESGTESTVDEDGNVAAAESVVYSGDTVTSNISEDALEKLKDAENGEAFAVETDKNYYVIQKVELDASEDSEDFESYRLEIMNAKSGEEFQEWLTEQAAAIEITKNQDAVKYYSPKKLTV